MLPTQTGEVASRLGRRRTPRSSARPNIGLVCADEKVAHCAARKLTRNELYLSVAPNSRVENGLLTSIGHTPDRQLVRAAQTNKVTTNLRPALAPTRSPNSHLIQWAGHPATVRRVLSDGFLLALVAVGALWAAYLLATRPGPRPLDQVPAAEVERNPIPAK